VELPLAFIGWFFTLFSIGALLLGGVLVIALVRAGDRQRQYLTFSFWNDVLLAGVWVMGLAGGVGVIRLEPAPEQGACFVVELPVPAPRP